MTQEPYTPWPRCDHCQHQWHGLPCGVFRCECSTACHNVPVIPKGDE